MSKTIYSPEVLEYSNKIMLGMQETAIETGIDFFGEEFADPELGRETFCRLICDTATRNFLEREDGEIMLDAEQFMQCMQESMIRASLESLRRKGLVDWVENENGDEMVFITEKGRDMGNSLFGEYVNDETSYQ